MSINYEEMTRLAIDRDVKNLVAVHNKVDWPPGMGRVAMRLYGAPWIWDIIYLNIMMFPELDLISWLWAPCRPIETYYKCFKDQ